jgi:pyridoxamine 5'-phosphate oxidase
MELSETSDPFVLFSEWFEAARESEPNDPDAMALATVAADGMPSVRMVLMKGHDRRGFAFYTNLESRKGQELTADPRAALCFHWKSQRRQIRVEGIVSPVTPEDADRYFASRARISRLGAWASFQSRPLDRRETLEARVAAFDAQYPGDTVPRPPHWSGFRLAPTRFEFWEDRQFRLHDRIEYVPDGDGWSGRRLYP